MSRMRAQRTMTAATGRSQTLASLMTMTATCAMFLLLLAFLLSIVCPSCSVGGLATQ